MLKLNEKMYYRRRKSKFTGISARNSQVRERFSSGMAKVSRSAEPTRHSRLRSWNHYFEGSIVLKRLALSSFPSLMRQIYVIVRRYSLIDTYCAIHKQSLMRHYYNYTLLRCNATKKMQICLIGISQHISLYPFYVLCICFTIQPQGTYLSTDVIAVSISYFIVLQIRLHTLKITNISAIKKRIAHK